MKLANVHYKENYINRCRQQTPGLSQDGTSSGHDVIHVFTTLELKLPDVFATLINLNKCQQPLNTHFWVWWQEHVSEWQDASETLGQRIHAVSPTGLQEGQYSTQTRGSFSVKYIVWMEDCATLYISIAVSFSDMQAACSIGANTLPYHADIIWSPCKFFSSEDTASMFPRENFKLQFIWPHDSFPLCLSFH